MIDPPTTLKTAPATRVPYCPGLVIHCTVSLSRGTMTKKLRLLLCLAVLTTLLSCNSGSKRILPSDEIVIGEFGSLTGTTATFGISTENGIDMAIDEINQGRRPAGQEGPGHRRRRSGQARRSADRRHEADHQRPGGRRSRRSRIVAHSGGGAGRAAERHSDDQSVLDQSQESPRSVTTSSASASSIRSRDW